LGLEKAIKSMKKLKAFRSLLIIKFIFFLILITPFLTSANDEFQRESEFEATITYKSFGLYKIDISLYQNIKWIETIACVEILIFDDVIIEPWSKNGRIVGGFFYVVDDEMPREDWESCQITGLYRNKPE
jgi:hypothetical protein